jgi:hypothetical protein
VRASTCCNGTEVESVPLNSEKLSQVTGCVATTVGTAQLNGCDVRSAPDDVTAPQLHCCDAGDGGRHGLLPGYLRTVTVTLSLALSPPGSVTVSV